MKLLDTYIRKNKNKKGYTTKRRYQQTRRDKQKTPQIMNDQLETGNGEVLADHMR
jgi:hypothetical protein